MATTETLTCRHCGEPDETVAPDNGLCFPCERARRRGWDLDDGDEFALEDRACREAARDYAEFTAPLIGETTGGKREAA